MSIELNQSKIVLNLLDSQLPLRTHCWDDATGKHKHNLLVCRSVQNTCVLIIFAQFIVNEIFTRTGD